VHWLLAAGVLIVAAVMAARRRSRADARRVLAWDALARDFMLGFDAESRSIRGKDRLLRLEMTAGRALLGLGPWVTRISTSYEGVVPEGLRLGLDAGSGHTAQAEVWGLLTDPEALRDLLGRIAELAELLLLR